MAVIHGGHLRPADSLPVLADLDHPVSWLAPGRFAVLIDTLLSWDRVLRPEPGFLFAVAGAQARLERLTSARVDCAG